MLFQKYQKGRKTGKICADKSSDLKIELDLSNYQIKADLKKAACVDTSILATKPELVTGVNAVKVSSTSELVSKLCNISGKKYRK